MRLLIPFVLSLVSLLLMLPAAVEMLVLPFETHVFQSPRNWRRVLTKIEGFFEENLKGR